MKWTPIAAIVCLAGLGITAMLKGIDGAVFSIVVAAIAGLGGYEIKVIRDKRKGGK